MDESDRAYRVEQAEQHFIVVGPDDTEVCRCATRVNAEHYATLLEGAHRVGYRRGYRDGRGAAEASIS